MFFFFGGGGRELSVETEFECSGQWLVCETHIS